MKSFSKRLIVTLVCIIGLISCNKSSEINDSTDGTPTITTSAISSITTSSVTSGGNISSDGGSAIIARGVCWNTTQYPTISNNISSDGTGTGSFSSSIDNLEPETKYYVRAYATNSNGTKYGNEQSFTTAKGERIIKDKDGNVYHSVTIGTQTWMVENLITTKYNDGTTIPNVTENTTWYSLTTGGYCDYNNATTYGTKYGHLYNWYAVNTGKLAPLGWHVATYDEWFILINYLGGYTVAGGKLKSSTNWGTPNTGATNSTGFSAYPGGVKGPSGFLGAGSSGDWWSSSAYSDTMGSLIFMRYDNAQCLGNRVEKYSGLSVRCIKD